MKRFGALILALVMLTGAIPLPVTAQAPGRVRVVSPQGPYQTPQEALAEAATGDTIEVRGGHYFGPLVVDKAVTLQGVDWPVIDGGGQGTVITLATEGAVLRGFHVVGSGVEPDRDHAGVTLKAPRTVVENNRLEDVLFGIFVAQADQAIVRGNTVTSKNEYEIGRKGDAIRLWYSQDVTVADNHVYQARDVVIWYSARVQITGNRIENGRYGVHLMYCDDADISGNQLFGNSVGIYVMYSRRVNLLHNDIRGQRGPSGYALGFKDADQVLARDNLLVDNRAGVFLDGTPFQPGSPVEFSQNVLAFNDLGVALMTAVRGVSFTSNTFWENVEQVAFQGGGQAGANTWQSNYWSDYPGFDADGDGLGEIPYRAERSFENLTDREPLLRVLLYSPAAQAIEFAARTFPIFKPQPKLIDPQPAFQPLPLPAWSARSRPVGAIVLDRLALAALGLGLIFISMLAVWLAFWRPRQVAVWARTMLESGTKI